MNLLVIFEPHEITIPVTVMILIEKATHIMILMAMVPLISYQNIILVGQLLQPKEMW